MAPDINNTNIVLIPKVKQPEKMSNFRSISLCNVIYKIISKVLTNRLKQILPSVISTTQSAFVPGRLITDNVLVAYELLTLCTPGRKAKKGSLALKLDISKRMTGWSGHSCRVLWPSWGSQRYGSIG